MTYFPFTFLFHVPGLSNPFASSAPAAPETETSDHSLVRSDTERLLKRNLDGDCSAETATESQSPGSAPTPAPTYPKRSPSSRAPPARLVRKRGWQPSSPVEPSQAAIFSHLTSGVIDTPSDSHRDMPGKEEDSEDVALDLPPAKRRKGLAESVISTAFNAALVGAAVGLTVFRLWKDRGKEIEQTPPPPYQEAWAKPTSATPSEPETTQPASRVQRALASASSHKRHGGSVRHRQKVVRKTVHIRRDKEISPRKTSPQLFQDESIGHSSFAHRSMSEDDTLDEMDWIGDRLAQLIEEGKRALGKEIVVASEAPEDEVDDGSGNWVEDEPEQSTSTFFSSSRRIIPSSPSKQSRYGDAYSVPNSTSPCLSTFPSHSRFHFDDLSLSASLRSTPNRSMSQTLESGCDEGSTALLSRTYDSESPSIHESMERARAAYRQRRGLGLGIDVQGTGH